MASGKEIKRRIRSVQSTGKITKAMKMVSASKLRRAQGSVVSARPYKDKLKEVLSRLVHLLAQQCQIHCWKYEK